MATIVSPYSSVAAFNPAQFNPVLVAENERVRVMLVCFEAGQFIPVHSPGVDMTMAVLEGKGLLAAADREEPVEAGSIAFIPADEVRGVKAETRLVALQVVTPPPTAVDHREVVARLRQGKWK